MNTKYRLELLEAFAATQPVDFFGFTAQYKTTHPEPAEEPIIPEPVVAVPEEAPKTTRKKKTPTTDETPTAEE
jgi:hypothetical protein